MLADHGLAEACERQPALGGGINVMNNGITCRAVAEAHGMKWTAPAFKKKSPARRTTSNHKGR